LELDVKKVEYPKGSGNFIPMRYDPELSFTRMLENGVVEFLDAAELVDMVYAESPVLMGETALARKKAIKEGLPFKDIIYTHCPIDPAGLVGFAAGLAPRPDMMQGPRFVFQCAMATQTIGEAAPGSVGFHNKRKMLMSGSLPTFITDTSKIVGLEDLPATQTLIVMIAPYLGQNQEDSLILNKASIDRGKLAQLVYSTEELQ
jgi:DNA-directed RNA polymerase beta subunit